MTKTQFMRKVRQLIKSNNEEILKEALKFQDCGAVNFEDYDNNFALPKIFMSAVCNHLAWQWRPLTAEHKKTVDNLKHFI